MYLWSIWWTRCNVGEHVAILLQQHNQFCYVQIEVLLSTSTIWILQRKKNNNCLVIKFTLIWVNKVSMVMYISLLPDGIMSLSLLFIFTPIYIWILLWKIYAIRCGDCEKCCVGGHAFMFTIIEGRYTSMLVSRYFTWRRHFAIFVNKINKILHKNLFHIIIRLLSAHINFWNLFF